MEKPPYPTPRALDPLDWMLLGLAVFCACAVLLDVLHLSRIDPPSEKFSSLNASLDSELAKIQTEFSESKRATEAVAIAHARGALDGSEDRNRRLVRESRGTLLLVGGAFLNLAVVVYRLARRLRRLLGDNPRTA
jgi:hypothetical protein